MTSNWSEKIILGGAFSEDIQTYRHTVSHLALKHIRQRWGEAIYRACKVQIRKKFSCLSL